MRSLFRLSTIAALLLSAVAISAETTPVPSTGRPAAGVPVKAVPQPGQASVDKIRGVNLGGWLVLEPWITPSLFEQFLPLPAASQAVDEWTFCEKLGRDEATRQLKNHWETWVTEEDFRKLVEAGINHVRIPIGYWAVDVAPGEPWVQGHTDYMRRAIDWAAKYKIKVIIDLHGAPGSQNGFDNSGRHGPIDWQKKPEYVQRTLTALDRLSSMFPEQKYPHVTSVELVNEPANWGLDMTKVRQFYQDGRSVVQRGQPNRIAAIHDAFLPLSNWTDFVKPYGNQRVYLDTHIYHVFDDNLLKLSYDKHIENACNNKRDIAASQAVVNTIVGEWSLAITDCAQWLNGFNVGSRWDGTIPARNGVPIYPNSTCTLDHDIRYFTPEYRQWLRRFTEIQLDAYEAGAGWFFWNFKTEREPQWSYLKGVEQGWIPKNPANRTYSCEGRR